MESKANAVQEMPLYISALMPVLQNACTIYNWQDVVIRIAEGR